MMLVLFTSLLFVCGFMIRGSMQTGETNRQVINCGAHEDCILLRKCPSFIEMLQKQIPGTRKKIQKNRCGHEGLHIKVCCSRTSPDHSSAYFPSECGYNPHAFDHIHNGNETEMGEMPWMGVLGYKKPGYNTIMFMCSGSVINARYVLTAAHCLDPQKLHGHQLLVVRLGEWNLATEKDCFETHSGESCAPPYIDLQIEKKIVHQMYNVERNLANDIALIRFSQTIDFRKTKGYILPICLPPYGLDIQFSTSRLPVVAGWGQTENAPESSILLKAEVPFADRMMCYNLYSEFGANQLCIGGNTKDSCQGDSGSPLILAGPHGPPYLQVGIVSFGFSCGLPRIPAVYTSFSHFRNWISDMLEPW